MKRPRNVDCGKIRRPIKRNKITDGIYGSTFLYLRFLLVWALVLMADFILEFRFEYLWPFWLLLRSVYDSFKYQGLAFSVFFVCIAITSDVICYLFIPVQWLFFAASTYVWVQYVWHTERGICLPTVSLWLLFVYIEASIRLRELKSLPFNLDLCRPFACHCIGYPVVTLGFGFKSYISYKMKLRRQKVIQKENDFYLQILQQALPAELAEKYTEPKPKALPQKSEEDDRISTPNGVSNTNSQKIEDENSKIIGRKKQNNEQDDESEYIEKPPPKPKDVNHFDEHSENNANESAKGFKNGPSRVLNEVEKMISPSPLPSKPNKPQNKQDNNPPNNRGKNKNREQSQTSPSSSSFANNKDEVIQRLETDVKKLKADLQQSRNSEQELKAQINRISSEEKSTRADFYQLQQDNENLQNKLHNLVTSRQQDKQTLTSVEKKLMDEKKSRSSLELQLLNERQKKNAAASDAQRALSMAQQATRECTESCKARRREVDSEMRQLRKENKLRDDQYRQLERETSALRQYKDNQKESEVLMKALSAMKDKNAELEKNLCAETHFKQDLFSALSNERNQIKILQNEVAEKDSEILDLKSKIAEVLALVPPVTSSHSHFSERNSSPLFSNSGFSPASPKDLSAASHPVFNSQQQQNGGSSDLASSSELNPNATDYTPKSAI